MIGRALGYRSDEPDSRDWDEGKLGLVASATPPTSISLPQCPIYNQGRTSSCVAQAMAGGIEILERTSTSTGSRRQIPVDVHTPSRLFIYFMSRRSHAGGPAIFDSGTYLRTAARAMNHFGVPDERWWKFSQNPVTVNRRPAFVASMRAKGRSGGQYYRIQSTGNDRVKAIQAALLKGYPVAFGTRVTEGFLDSNGPVIVDKPSYDQKFAGGHAMLIVGYDQRPGGLLFEVRNSWGTGYRDGGYVWLTEDYIRWPHSNDFQIIKGWRNLQAAA